MVAAGTISTQTNISLEADDLPGFISRWLVAKSTYFHLDFYLLSTDKYYRDSRTGSLSLRHRAILFSAQELSHTFLQKHIYPCSAVEFAFKRVISYLPLGEANFWLFQNW